MIVVKHPVVLYNMDGNHMLSPNFFRGVLDQNENLVGKFFTRLRHSLVVVDSEVTVDGRAIAPDVTPYATRYTV